MRKSKDATVTTGLGRFALGFSLLSCCGALALVLQVSCTGFSPVAISSPGVTSNVAPILTIIAPDEDEEISQGDSFIVRWTDSDPDSNALIDIDLLEIDGLNVFPVAGGIRENDVTLDRFQVNTSSILIGTYFVRMTIDDGANTPVVVFAEDPNTGNRVQITIAPPGQAGGNVPPQVVLIEPQTNVGTSQGDVVTISIRPTLLNPGPPGSPDPGLAFHYDQEDDVDVTILLDLDNDPTNDDFRNDDDPGNIILERDFIAEGRFDQIDFDVVIDVQEIPIRRDGLPYFVRATVDDGLKTTHTYASGRLYVLELVEGSASSNRRTIDLGQIGRTLAGNRWLGFNPLANLGTKMISARDQDRDGIGDFAVVAQYGNPNNRGNIGEVYLIFGRQLRFGGDININSVSTSIPSTSRSRIRGSVYSPHPDFLLADAGVIDIGLGDDRRIGFVEDLAEPYTLGITDIDFISNLGTHPAYGECAPPAAGVSEMIVGMAHNEYLATTRDDDMGDDPDCDDPGCFLPFCYPDNFSNNYSTDDEPDPSLFVRYGETAPFGAIEEKMGTVSVVYGENNLIALDVEEVDDGIPCNNNLAPTREVFSLTSAGSEPGVEEHDPPIVLQPAGVRFNVAIFDNFGHNNPGTSPFQIDPLNSHYGMNVAVLADIDLNGFDEIIISAPRNELETQQLLSEAGEAHPHIATRLARANIVVWMGQNFAAMSNDEDDCHHFPMLSTRPDNDGSCGQMLVARTFEAGYHTGGIGLSVIQFPGWFFIRGEKSSDKLGGATSAGDFNLDGPADILCGAPFADPTLDANNNGFIDPDDPTIFNGGTVYVVYSRFPYGNVELNSANNPNFRSPMLRIFGETPGDHLGLKQERGNDINGDAIDDVVIASEDYNGMGMVDNGLVAVVFGDQQIDGDRVVSQIATAELKGMRIYGANDGDGFGADISPAGDFNRDGLGDLLISAPGETVTLQGEDKPRNGVVYLVFGGRHLENKVFTSDQIGTEELPGIVFAGPYQVGTLDAIEVDKPVFVTDPTGCVLDQDGDGEIDNFECLCDPELYEMTDCGLLKSDGVTALIKIDDAAPSRVGFIGDVNGDGFDDIMIGNPTADFFDPTQPGSARRPDAGEAYLIYGNNFGANTVNVQP
ncbi:MAG: integrin alpha [Planctomycetota bacterium]|nr:integrin alpha [Planctomycetota bacterium]